MTKCSRCDGTGLEPEVAVGFEEFWAAYGYKEGKQAALKAWEKTAKTRPANLLECVHRYHGSKKWRDGIKLHASTWLNKRRWEDEPEGVKPLEDFGQPQTSDDSRKARFISIARQMLEALQPNVPYPANVDLLDELSIQKTPEDVFALFHETTGLRIGDSY